jgi:uncharacterized iron-regulated membrane protein
VWLAITLGIVGLALVLLVITGLSAWRRFRKMRRAGGRFGRRVSSVAEAAALLAERLEQP